MTPRESLNKILEASLEAGGITNPENITAPYAIGRWVSVEERLPKFDEEGDFMGFIKFRDQDRPICDYFHESLFVEAITHWLELNLPENHNE